jgi:hypothetical protein
MKKIIFAVTAIASLFVASHSFAGGQLDDLDITNTVPDANGVGLAALVGIRWDERAIPVRYRINNTSSQIPNPLGAPVLDVATARAALQSSFDRWNKIPTSYIDMRIVGEVSNPGLVGFDFVNELSFNTPENFGAIASSPSVSLVSDECLIDGQDINGDGVSDVSAAIRGVTDIGGRNVFPAGCYKAGTILDNDVQFNTKTSNGFRFTVNDADIDNVGRSVDLITVATHEFGHSHGHSHITVNNKSARNGRGGIMFPSINTRDPVSELEQRDLYSDDIANASRIYPEGTAASGPAAIQAGDFPFRFAYTKIRGKVIDGITGLPVVGANIFAINRLTGEVVSTAYSGSARLLVNFVTGALELASEVDSFANGDYELIVPAGVYSVGIQALDGTPVGAGQVSTTAFIGGLYGQQTFDRTFWNPRLNFGLAPVYGDASPVLALPFIDTRRIDFRTERSAVAGNTDARLGFGFSDVSPGTYYVTSVPVQSILDRFPNGFGVQGALFETLVSDSSVVPRFDVAAIIPGKVDASGNIVRIDMNRPLLQKNDFLALDTDLSPLYALNPDALASRIRNGYRTGQFDTLFIVLRVPNVTPFPGPSGTPPLIGVTAANSPGSFSYLSQDGGVTFDRVDFGWRFRLSITPAS